LGLFLAVAKIKLWFAKITAMGEIRIGRHCRGEKAARESQSQWRSRASGF